MNSAAANIHEHKVFLQVVELIKQSKHKVFAAVNTELIDLYWKIGESISRKVQSDGWGQGTVEELSRFIQKEMIGSRGFSPQNLWRMKQFYEVYSSSPIEADQNVAQITNLCYDEFEFNLKSDI